MFLLLRAKSIFTDRLGNTGSVCNKDSTEEKRRMERRKQEKRVLSYSKEPVLLPCPALPYPRLPLGPEQPLLVRKHWIPSLWSQSP